MSPYPDRNGAPNHGPSWTATADRVRQLLGRYHALAPDAPADELLHEISLGIERVAGVDLDTAYELECELMDPHAGAADGWPPESDDWRWEADADRLVVDEEFAAPDTIYYLGDDGDGPDARLLLLVRPAHSSSSILDEYPEVGWYQLVQEERNRFRLRAAPAPGRHIGREDLLVA